MCPKSLLFNTLKKAVSLGNLFLNKDLLMFFYPATDRKCLMNVFVVVIVVVIKTQGEGNFNEEFAGGQFTNAKS